MSIQSQENRMRKLARLLSSDLGYIWGERESGPNGAKKETMSYPQLLERLGRMHREYAYERAA